MQRHLRFVASAGLALGACGACHRLPIWEGDVPDISPVEREALDLCGRGEVTAAGGRRLQRPPYLQSVTQTSAVVAWAAPPEQAWVEVRPATGEDEETGELERVAATYGGDPARRERNLRHSSLGRAAAPDSFYVQRADLEDLEPDTLYCYQLVSQDGPLTEPAPLLTGAGPGHGDDDPVRFVLLADSGAGSAAQRAIGRLLDATPFDFMLFAGDLAYEEGTASQLQSRFFEVYRDYLAFTPAFTAIGNHERRTRNGAPYFEAFILPGAERYYSFDWGDVHIIAIDTTGGYAEQVAWLEKDLAGNQLPFTIVFGHHPMYSNSIRGPHEALRRRFWPVLAHHHVPLVVMGHEHHYERFFPRDGIIHVVSGGGGGRLTRLYSKASTVKQRTVHHYLAFEVTRDKLVMRAIDIDGKEFDRIELDAPRPAQARQ